MHRNGVTFVEYKGYKADCGMHRLPNGVTFVGPSRERVVGLLKDRYGVRLTRKKPIDGQKPFKPCNEHLYNSLKKRAERHGLSSLEEERKLRGI